VEGSAARWKSHAASSHGAGMLAPMSCCLVSAVAALDTALACVTGTPADSADPAALQLRLLQTVVEVAAEKNSRVIVVPIPVELLRLLDRASAAGRAHRPA
jgi:hypothetical protein